MRDLFAVALATSVLSACVAVQDTAHEHESGDRVAALVLSGDELATELSSSPIREAPVPFVRIGLMWEAEAATSLEISISEDGANWSDWRTADVFGAEVEQSAVFIGEIPVLDPDLELASFYRLRAGAGSPPTFVALEFLEQTLTEAIEDGEMMDGDEPVPLAVQVGDANVHTRSEWGARAPKCVSSHSPNRFTIHHTVTPNNDSQSPQARLRGIQSYHQNVRGWCDIGYQYLISQDGRLWEGRGAARLGSHVGGGNRNNVGISYIGDYMNRQPSTTQINATGALIAGLADRYNISLSSNAKVKGHRDQGNTSCPGNALYGKLGAIRTAARDGGSPPPPPPPPPMGTTVKGVVYVGNDTSNRLAGVTVRLGSRTATTSSIGYFEFTNVSGSSVSPSATASGYAPSGVTRATTGATTWASISMTRATGTAILQGVVYRGSNSSNRVGNAVIELSSGVVVQTDANGYYRLDSLAPGPVTITARSGSDSGSVSRTLENGSVSWGSVSL